jgi:histidine triad (HIT) family protein
MPRDANCIFCKIVEGSVPAARVLETEHALVFLDVGPLNHGHTLVIPKEHHPTLAELPDHLSAAAASLLPRVCRAVKSATSAAGLNVLVNVGRVAGQSVDHVHWHIIPRHAGDTIRWPWNPGRYEATEIENLRDRIAAKLSSA